MVQTPGYGHAEAAAPALDVQGLHVRIRSDAGAFFAVRDMAFSLAPGETFAIAGESGCGKSTVALALMQLVAVTSGSVRFVGREIAALPPAEVITHRRRMQIVFQDPYSSRNPRQPVAAIMRAPLDIHAIGTPTERHRKVEDLLARVGLRADQGDSYPHQLSGGPRQRVGPSLHRVAAALGAARAST